MEDEVRSQSVFDLARAIWARRKWMAVLSFVGPLALVFSVLAFMPKLYEARATVLVERQHMPESLVKATVSNELEMRLHAIHEEVLSRARLEELITHFNLYPALRKDGVAKAAVQRLRDDIKVEKKTERNAAAREPTTVAFTVLYRDPDPIKAAEVTNALARFYVVTNAKKRERQANATAAFLKLELEQTEQALDQQEKKVGDYKKRNAGALPDQAHMNMLTMERLYSELRMNRDAQMRIAERAEMPGPGGGGMDLPPQHDRAAARLALLRQELTELSTRYTDKYPDVVAKKQEIADLETQVANAPKRGAPAFSQPPAQRPRAADSRVAALRTEEQQLLDRIAGYQKRIEETPRREQEFQEIARDYQTTKDLYRSLKQRYEEALLGENMETQHRGEMFRIVEPALPPDSPSAPRTARLALLGLIASLALAAVAVMVSEQVDTSFHSIDDLRAHLGAPVVAGAIPHIVTPDDERRRKRRVHLYAACSVVAIAIIVGLSGLIASGNYDLVAFLARRG